ncbi:MAG: hypothetical protein Unbinned1446contig1005_18 [Prokaryotic dsDNA virus sp.]|nr:MAG: hypothetical protein Unbinned1446contig1005_18 [Prokaryotic dsDNA virus sp.]
MASEIVVNLTVKTEKAARELEDFAAELNEVSETAGKGAKSASKDWGGVADLFSGLLPRNIQGLLRSFKSTERGVKRVSRSFKALKAAWASIGIGLIIIALEALIENWDAVAEALGFVDAAAEKNAKQTAEQNAAVQKLTNSTSSYIDILKDQAATDAQRAEALAQLNKEFNNIIDTEADAATQIEQANAALKAKEDLERATVKQRQTLADLDDAALARGDGTLKNAREQSKFMENKFRAQIRLNKELEEAEEANQEAVAELTAAQAAYNKLVGESAERTKERLENERAAELAAKKAQSEAQKREAQRLQFLEQIAVFEEELGKEGEELATLRLKRQQKAELARAEAANLSNEDILRLRKQHNEQLIALQNEYNKERQDEEKDALERIEMATLTQDERQRKQVNDQYDDLIKLAKQYGIDTVEIEEARRKALADLPNKELDAQKRLFDELNKMFLSDADRQLLEAQQEFDARMLQAAGNQELELLALRAFEAEKADIAKQGADEQAKQDEAVLQSKINLADNLNSVIGQYADLVSETTQAEVDAAKVRGATDAEIERIEKQGAERAKRLAITQVLISQATAIADGIAAAVKAGKDTGPAAPFVIAGYIAGIVGSIIAAFAQVKGLMNQAQARGSQQVASTAAQVTPLIPQQTQNEFTSENLERNFKAFVVQSDLQGQSEQLGRIEQRASL